LWWSLRLSVVCAVVLGVGRFRLLGKTDKRTLSGLEFDSPRLHDTPVRRIEVAGLRHRACEVERYRHRYPYSIV